MLGSDGGPFPSTLVPNAVMFMSVEGEQVDEETSNTWLQIPFSQEDAGTVAKPQLLPEMESE